MDDCDLEALRACGVCFRPNQFPVVQCVNGHIYCRACFRRTGQCPSCRVEVNANQPVRNLLADSLTDTFGIPTRCRHEGCSFSALTTERQVHEARCGHKPVCCNTCGEACTLRTLLWHYAMVHRVPTTVASESGRHALPLPRGEEASSVILSSEHDNPVVVVHWVNSGNGLYGVWAQASFDADTEAWEVEVQVAGPSCTLSCSCAIRPIRNENDPSTPPPTGSTPRIDLAPFGDEARLYAQVRQRQVTAHMSQTPPPPPAALPPTT